MVGRVHRQGRVRKAGERNGPMSVVFFFFFSSSSSPACSCSMGFNGRRGGHASVSAIRRGACGAVSCAFHSHRRKRKSRAEEESMERANMAGLRAGGTGWLSAGARTGLAGEDGGGEGRATSATSAELGRRLIGSRPTAAHPQPTSPGLLQVPVQVRVPEVPWVRCSSAKGSARPP